MYIFFQKVDTFEHRMKGLERVQNSKLRVHISNKNPF